MIKIEAFVFNPFSENTYIVFDSETKDGFVVDPGCSDKREEEEFDNFIVGNDIKLKYLFNTHGHIDHILGNLYVKNKYSPAFYFPQKELNFFHIMANEAYKYGVNYNMPPLPDMFFDESIKLKLGNSLINFISTPGHSPDEYCIFLPNEKICFSGDVLFKESIGRTDLWEGDYHKLIFSITQKLYTLPKETVVFPGHGDCTTIEYELMNNPFTKNG
jgi:hydroxyacylglutathione hydrolase